MGKKLRLFKSHAESLSRALNDQSLPYTPTLHPYPTPHTPTLHPTPLLYTPTLHPHSPTPTPHTPPRSPCDLQPCNPCNPIAHPQPRSTARPAALRVTTQPAQLYATPRRATPGTGRSSSTNATPAGCGPPRPRQRPRPRRLPSPRSSAAVRRASRSTEHLCAAAVYLHERARRHCTFPPRTAGAALGLPPRRLSPYALATPAHQRLCLYYPLSSISTTTRLYVQYRLTVDFSGCGVAAASRACAPLGSRCKPPSYSTRVHCLFALTSDFLTQVAVAAERAPAVGARDTCYKLWNGQRAQLLFFCGAWPVEAAAQHTVYCARESARI